MNLALRIDETSQAHAKELESIREINVFTLSRIQSIAEQYARGFDWESIDGRSRGELHFQLKDVIVRFNLYDNFTLRQAVRALIDPAGW